MFYDPVVDPDDVAAIGIVIFREVELVSRLGGGVGQTKSLDQLGSKFCAGALVNERCTQLPSFA